MAQKSIKKRPKARPQKKVKRSAARSNGKLGEKAKYFLSHLSSRNLSLLDDFYEPEATFQDPFLTLKGVNAIRAYFFPFLKSVSNVRFNFEGTIENKNECVLLWTVQFKNRWIPMVRPTVCNGSSYFKFSDSNGKVIYQRDMLDLNQLVLDNMPLLGPIIRRAKVQIADYLARKPVLAQLE